MKSKKEELEQRGGTVVSKINAELDKARAEIERLKAELDEAYNDLAEARKGFGNGPQNDGKSFTGGVGAGGSKGGKKKMTQAYDKDEDDDQDGAPGTKGGRKKKISYLQPDDDDD